MAVSALGLPCTLINMLETLVDKNTLSSWNIYSNKNNIVCVNIRFIQGDIGDPIQPAYYRKQSAKQATRNKQRAADHRAGIHTRTEHTHHDTSLHFKKRKLDHGSPETLRQCISTNHRELLDTPEVVIKDEYQDIVCTVPASPVPDPNPIPNVFDTPELFTEPNADMLDDSDLSEILPSEAVDDTDSISDILPPPSPHRSGQPFLDTDHDAPLQTLESWTPEVSVNTMKPMSHPHKISFLPPPPNVSPSPSPSPPQSPTRPPDQLSTMKQLEYLMRESLRRSILKEAK